jgi:hypothetical protein
MHFFDTVLRQLWFQARSKGSCEQNAQPRHVYPQKTPDSYLKDFLEILNLGFLLNFVDIPMFVKTRQKKHFA